MSTKIEMPDFLPPLPPVPEGYDRWEYRGENWRCDGGPATTYAFATSADHAAKHGWPHEWVIREDRWPDGMGFYIEAVKIEPQKTTTISEPDMVNRPPHYTTSSIECIDAIRAALTPEEFRGFCKGNALKYVWREKNKGGDQDLSKAAWYLNKSKEEQP